MAETDGELPHFGGVEAECGFEEARVAILPVPYEGTDSYGAGTARGPEAILRASTQVELYDEQTGLEPFRAGIWTDRPLAIPEGKTEAVVGAVAERIGELMDAGKFVVMLGGEHSITPGGVSAAAARREGLRLVQLDAHADLRESYEGNPWSHASAMARCLDLAPIRAVGIRNYSVEEAARIRAGIPGYAIVHAWEMEDERWISRALEGLDGAPVYLTIDLDYFDPSVIPATGTPEPGGMFWYEVLDLLKGVCAAKTIVGFDVVELSPHPGDLASAFTIAKLVYKIMGFLKTK